MTMLLLYLPLTLLALFAWRALNFYRNYTAALKIGLPLLLSPVDPLDPLWLMSKDLLTPLLALFPSRLTAWRKRAYIGWNFPDYYATNAALQCGAFTIVTPGELEVYVGDPAAADDVLSRQRRDFIKSPAMYDLLNVFGPNVNTSNGAVWARHRRITVPPFNERNSGLVWREALRQTGEMAGMWTETSAQVGADGKGGVRSTPSDVMLLALHVLTAAGFGVKFSFREAGLGDLKPAQESGHSMTYRDALNFIIRNMVSVILLRLSKALRVPRSLLLGKLKLIDQAVDEFRRYLSEMIEQERKSIAAADAGEIDAGDRSNLMSVLLRSSEQARLNSDKELATADGEDAGPANTGGLSDDEVFGNLFLYNLAGHDTTANTISFAITLLTVFPEWQEWIGEEVDAVFPVREDVVGEEDETADWDYESSFPKLQRCLALMMETLRLYGPVVAIPRYTSSSYQSLVISGKTHVIAPRTNVYINLAALHTHPEHWGPDPLTWRPDRWIIKDRSTGAEEVLTPTPGSFNPWAGGPRVCPGRKFSQVEFVAVLARLLRRGRRVEAVRERGESAEQARGRILRVVEESRVEFTLKMVKPERVGLRWVENGKGRSG